MPGLPRIDSVGGLSFVLNCRGGRVVTIDIGASPYTGVRLDLRPRGIWLVTTRNDLSATRFLIHPVGASIVLIAHGR
jgi:hypothetical protein